MLEGIKKTPLKVCFQELASKEGELFATEIKQIVENNQLKGRLDFYLRYHKTHNPCHYVQRVTEFYKRLHPQINALQIERATHVWEPLFSDMQKLTFAFLLRRGLSPDEKTSQLAIDAATDAALEIIDAVFPYDTNFKAWAYHFIRHACWRQMRQSMRIDKFPESHLGEELLEIVGNGNNPSPEDQIALQELLINALEKLSLNRQHVLFLRYTYELSSKEIGEIMGKRAGAIDQLHRNALIQLRAILKSGNSHD